MGVPFYHSLVRKLSTKMQPQKPPVRQSMFDKQFSDLYKLADMAGKAAADKCKPVPMVVIERANPFDDNSPIIRQYEPVMGGCCGFAWVNIKPGNSAFANWLKKTGKARKDSYYGGVTIWISDYGQSMDLKESYAYAFAKVLSDNGFKAYGNSRMD